MCNPSEDASPTFSGFVRPYFSVYITSLCVCDTSVSSGVGSP